MEITQKAYEDLRTYIQTNWKYLELRDGTGTPIVRIGIGDSRISWTHNPGSQTLELTLIVKGSDSDITIPQTIKYSAVYKVATGGDALAIEEFTPFTLEADGDQLTVKHRIEVPRVW